MRKLIFAINTTLEGCVDHTKQIALNKFKIRERYASLRQTNYQTRQFHKKHSGQTPRKA